MLLAPLESLGVPTLTLSVLNQPHPHIDTTVSYSRACRKVVSLSPCQHARCWVNFRRIDPSTLRAEPAPSTRLTSECESRRLESSLSSDQIRSAKVSRGGDFYSAFGALL
jgi:hypothetical protein